MKINHNELKEQLKITYEAKLPLFIWGKVGIGKSSVVREIAKEIAKENNLKFTERDINNTDKFGFIDIRISQLEPSDLRGLPNINKDDKTTEWLIPDWLPKNPESKGILFFDELNLSPPSIQGVAYQLILDRKIGNYVLPEGWLVLSAGNGIDDKCNVFDMSNALKNRLSHSELDIPTADDWIDWGLNNDIDNRILSFIKFKPSALFKYDEKNQDNAFPTPRSWAFCNRLIKGKENLKLLQILASSVVGEGIAREFIAFLKLQNKIDLNKILENPESVQNIEEIDLKYVLLGTIAEKYRSKKEILDKCLNVCEYLEPDFSVLLLRLLKGTNKNHFEKSLKNSKKGLKILEKYSEILV